MSTNLSPIIPPAVPSDPANTLFNIFCTTRPFGMSKTTGDIQSEESAKDSAKSFDTKNVLALPSCDEAVARQEDLCSNSSEQNAPAIKTQSDTVDNTSPDPQEESTLSDIDPAKKRELEEKFQELINSPRYWANPNRIKRLEDALVLPVYDDRSMQQFYISAEAELVEKEMKAAVKDRRTPVLPTQEQIMELAEQKHHEKYVLEPMRKAEKEAKKKKAA